MKKWLHTLYSILAFLLIIACAFGVIKGMALSENFYEKEYIKLNRAEHIGMSQEDLMKTTRQLIGYMNNTEPELDVKATINGQEREVFNEQERLHMVDVLKLIGGWNLYMYLVFGLSAAALVLFFFIVRGRRLFTLSKIFVTGSIIAIAFFGILGVWAAIDFNAFWTSFHLIFFNNDLWLMDSSTSVMINMFPSQFFNDIVMRILMYTGIVVGIPLLLSIACIIANRRKKA